jgi:CRP/FNR family transcriptional regulator
MENHEESRTTEIPAACRTCEVRLDGVCQVMTPGQLRELNRVGRRKTIEPGAELHSQGEPIVSYANILSGVVKLTKVLSDGRQQIVGLQFASDFVGQPFSEESAISAVAATDTELCAVPKSAMDRMIS